MDRSFPALLPLNPAAVWGYMGVTWAPEKGDCALYVRAYMCHLGDAFQRRQHQRRQTRSRVGRFEGVVNRIPVCVDQKVFKKKVTQCSLVPIRIG